MTETEAHVARVKSFIGKRVRVCQAPLADMFPVGIEAKVMEPPGNLPGPTHAPALVAVVERSAPAGPVRIGITEDGAGLWGFEPLSPWLPPGIPWGAEVIVKTSLRHRDLIGRRGTLEQPPVRSQLLARLRIGTDVWPIDRAQDWELEAAPALGMPCGKDTFLWGEELHVKRCLDHPALEGLTGELSAPPEGSGLAGLFWVAGSRFEISRGSRWQFERTDADLIPNDAALDAELTAAEHAAGVDTRAPLRRSREVYDHMAFTLDLDAAVKEIRDLLVEKNQAYGNSALDPVRIFSKADPMEQLFVRIDDKLSRLKRGHAAGEDVVKDLQGYLLLVRVAQMRAERNKT